MVEESILHVLRTYPDYCRRVWYCSTYKIQYLLLVDKSILGTYPTGTHITTRTLHCTYLRPAPTTLTRPTQHAA
jgi:hypothetical protein